jgi:antitoxin FitA
MSTITIPLSDERLKQIEELARRVNVSPEELARPGLEDWLRQPREDFVQAAAHVLQKNADLYRRLA